MNNTPLWSTGAKATAGSHPTESIPTTPVRERDYTSGSMHHQETQLNSNGMLPNSPPNFSTYMDDHHDHTGFGTDAPGYASCQWHGMGGHYGVYAVVLLLRPWRRCRHRLLPRQRKQCRELSASPCYQILV